MSDPTAPPVPEIVTSIEDKVREQGAAVLEDLFLLGYVPKSKKYLVYQYENIEFNVVFRSLVPYEIREVHEQAGKASTPVGRAISEQIETLARAIETVNDMPLVLPANEREEFFRKYKRYPSPLEMARIFLIDKLKSDHVLDMLFEAYTEFANEIFEHFDSVKKKLKTQKSSS